MKEVEFWIVGGGSLVVETEDSVAQALSDGWFAKILTAQGKVKQSDCSVLHVDFSKIAAFDVRDVKEKTGTGFHSTESVLEGRERAK